MPLSKLKYLVGLDEEMLCVELENISVQHFRSLFSGFNKDTPHKDIQELLEKSDVDIDVWLGDISQTSFREYVNFTIEAYEPKWEEKNTHVDPRLVEFIKHSAVDVIDQNLFMKIALTLRFEQLQKALVDCKDARFNNILQEQKDAVSLVLSKL